MVNVWWSSAGMIRCDFKKPDVWITVETYCNQLDEIILKLKEKQPRLVKRSIPIFLYANGIIHTAQMNVEKLQALEFGISSTSSIFTRPNHC
ncbi:mariner transposase [Nephila pilipes]|uniref:Mariner transposase n=1 Tax=Nephila pilipes TaxID=299642 RepID=A0A8X6TUX5_NEPPI|nr:mariner transposase [Nephila pilipes]